MILFDSIAVKRDLVVNIALGLRQTDTPEMLEVMKFMRFHLLDACAGAIQSRKRRSRSAGLRGASSC
jgi:hypothetical protein